MKKRIIFVSVLFLAAASLFCDNSGSGKGAVKLETPQQKFSYAIGIDIGSQVKQIPTTLDVDALCQGIKDTLGGKGIAMTAKEIDSVRAAMFQSMQAAQMQKSQQAGEKNKAEGEKFLAENKSKAGIKTTASGLQYSVMTEGKGPHPKAEDVVTVHYRGTLIDGTEFDNSYTRKEPATFKLNQVIPGWTEGLQLMTVGSKYMFYIPSELGYGTRGGGQKIGPNSTLIFQVELISIQKPTPAQTPSPAQAPK
jgi:FKBP-type peptidyl-prolyl cis-trans isomerase FkpA